MLRGNDVSDIHEFKRQGLSLQQISALTGFDRKTIRKYLRQPIRPRYGPRPPRLTKLDPYSDYIEQRLRAGVWNAVVLMRELTERGYTGGYTAIKDYIRPKRREAQAVAVRRFETPPGHQAQVDWGHLGHIDMPDGRRLSLYAFVCTLGHSRAIFADIATDQTLPTFLRLHEAAFTFLGGVPSEILYDHVKTVVLGTDDRGEIQWQNTFADFARYWGFAPRLCRPYRPQTKGKVERSIGYLRTSFLCGRTAVDIPDLRRQLQAWLGNIANQRVHGTTHHIVADAWHLEQAHLMPVHGRAPYPFVVEHVRHVSRDAYVTYAANRYSVPWQAVGMEVVVREVNDTLEIWRDTQCLAVHLRVLSRHQVMTVPAHHASMPHGGRVRGKVRLSLKATAPDVEVRSLSVYAALVDDAEVAA